jgi:hypothetical protein
MGALQTTAGLRPGMILMIAAGDGVEEREVVEVLSDRLVRVRYLTSGFPHYVGKIFAGHVGQYCLRDDDDPNGR